MPLMYLSTVSDKSLPDDLSPINLKDHPNQNIGGKGDFIRPQGSFPQFETSLVWEKVMVFLNLVFFNVIYF